MLAVYFGAVAVGLVLLIGLLSLEHDDALGGRDETDRLAQLARALGWEK